MAISKKGRRRITIGDRLYLWWVCDTDPEYGSGSCLALTVASEDGRFFVRYYLGQKPDRRYLIVQGQEFEGLPEAGSCWIRVQCPEWQAGSSVTPADVRRLVEWCASAGRPLIRVNYRGDPLVTSNEL
jgi:hypothetical protein